MPSSYCGGIGDYQITTTSNYNLYCVINQIAKLKSINKTKFTTIKRLEHLTKLYLYVFVFVFVFFVLFVSLSIIKYKYIYDVHI